MARLEDRTNVKADTAYPAGRYDSQVYDIPAGEDSYAIALSRSAWPATGSEVVQVLAEVSFDGGKTWYNWGGFGAHGGPSAPHWATGKPQTESWINLEKLPNKESADRKARVTITAAVPLTTTAVIEKGHRATQIGIRNR